MRKLLTLVAVLLIFGAYARPAKADPAVMLPAGFAIAQSSAMQVTAVMGSALFAAWVFPYLNTTGEKPFEEMFTSVDYKYPNDLKVVYSPSNLHADHKPYHVMTQWGDSIRSD